MSKRIDTAVIIVGGGPVGLTLAYDLGLRGVPCVLVEADAGTGLELLAKAGTFNERTVEYFRKMGVADDIINAGFPLDYPRDTLYVTALNGFVLGRDPLPSAKDRIPFPETREIPARCPQYVFDPLMAGKVKDLGMTQVLYGAVWRSMSEDADGVTSVVEGPDGEHLTVRSKYIVGCDGAGSNVRRAAGIAFEGNDLDYSVSAMIEFEALEDLHPHGRAERFMFVGEDGKTWANITSVDGRKLWRMTLVGFTERQQPDSNDYDAAMRRALGTDEGDWILHRVMPWRRSHYTAERFAQGRLFLAGDAAHTTSPTGGHGLNTGLGDVSDLAWMLQALIEGWGGRSLIDAYNAERRPVAIRNGNFSSRNYGAWVEEAKWDRLFEDSPEGEKQRRALGDQMNARLQPEWHSFGVAMGYRYDESPIVVGDGTPPTPDDASVYVQTARPGHRAPFVRFADGTATIDLLDRDAFTLLVLGDEPASADIGRAEAAAAGLGVPLTVVRVSEPTVAAAYDRPWVLVRPDGMVTWRGDELPDPRDLLLTVTGHA
ncbi:FAD-dependent monooxygenase [Streptomyces sp. NBC_01390]|uniref:FAD-dependent monooxygenase n=1 Tax=Streptomyces sp. NBC_01390 TaxID=2903850 RepID=UPI0032455341